MVEYLFANHPFPQFLMNQWCTYYRTTSVIVRPFDGVFDSPLFKQQQGIVLVFL